MLTAEALAHRVRIARANTTIFAAELCAVLVERDMSQAKLARLLDIDKVRLHHLCNGRMVPSERDAVKLIEWMVAA